VTPTQQARVVGFLASLAARGVGLTLLRTGQTVTALVEKDAPDGQEFRHGEAESLGDRIHVLRSQAPAGAGVGDVFQDAASGFTYRIVEVDNRPSNIAIVYRCETAEVAS
jgi:hypothetical protein